MAIRFTETEKWRDTWFRKLSPNEKLLFIFMTETCNNAGFLEFDIEAISFSTGLSEDEILGAKKGLSRGCLEVDGWIWIKRFLRHQKNESLNPFNNAHKQIITLLNAQMSRFSGDKEFDDFVESDGLVGHVKKLAPKQPLNRGTGNGNGNGNGKEDVVESFTEAIAEEIYREYPRKIGKSAAMKAITRALKKVDADTLRIKTREFCRSQVGKDLQYCPHPATWYNQERWTDIDVRIVTPNANGNDEERAAYYSMIASEGIIA